MYLPHFSLHLNLANDTMSSKAGTKLRNCRLTQYRYHIKKACLKTGRRKL